MRGCRVHVKNCIEIIKIWITALEVSHITFQKLPCLITTLRSAGGSHTVTELNYNLIEGFFPFAFHHVSEVIMNYTIFPILFCVIFLQNPIEQIMIGIHAIFEQSRQKATPHEPGGVAFCR